MLSAKENRGRDKEGVTGALIMELAPFSSWSQVELCPTAQLCQTHGKPLRFIAPRRAVGLRAEAALAPRLRATDRLSVQHLAKGTPVWR